MPRIPQISEEQADWFWARVDRRGPDECWEWVSSSLAGNGYGYLTLDGENYYAHIIAFFLAINVWPSGRLIMHSCDNIICCNPTHLSDGTYGDNIRDCVAKGRHARTNTGGPSKGDLHHNTLLSNNDVTEIKRLGLVFGSTYIARLPRFQGKISRTGVDLILNGETWSHIQ